MSASSRNCALSCRDCSASTVAAATAAALPAWLWMRVSASLGHTSSGGVLSPSCGLANTGILRSTKLLAPRCLKTCSNTEIIIPF